MSGFCPNCGTILDPPTEIDDNVKCTFCPFKCNYEELAVKEVVTKSINKPKPAWIMDDEEEDDERKNKNKHATIEEPCPKCGHHELYFYTMQLRSVDEGSTVFYECPKCKHKFSQNN